MVQIRYLVFGGSVLAVWLRRRYTLPGKNSGKVEKFTLKYCNPCYAPSLKALFHARQRSSSTPGRSSTTASHPRSSLDGGVSFVSVSTTPGAPDLSDVTREVTSLSNLLSSCNEPIPYIVLDSPTATQIDATQQIDEGTHIASSFLLAGFANVIGTCGRHMTRQVWKWQ